MRAWSPAPDRGTLSHPPIPKEAGLPEETIGDRARETGRVAREIRRLEALGARRRLRVRVLRALRGILGAGATLAALVKLKLAGSLALKLGIAALMGLALAWPFVSLALLILFGLVLTVIGLVLGEDVSCPETGCDCGCDRREKRGARLKQRIAERRAWLAAPSGPAPSLLRSGRGRKASP